MKEGSFWPFAIFGLLGLNVIICGITVYAATRNPEARAVEPDYYQKALNWDLNRTAWHTPEQMGLATTASIVQHEGRGRVIIQIRGTLDAQRLESTMFHAGRAAERYEVTLLRTARDPDGWNTYEAWLPAKHKGMWEVRIAEPVSNLRFDRRIEYGVLPLEG